MCTFLMDVNLMNKDEFYMKLAIEEAKKAYDKDEVPVGAIIVLNDEVISKSHNLREITNDITNHAELNAIRAASKTTGDWRLEGAIMYVTLFPCSMCISAIVQSRIERLVVGAPTKDLNSREIALKILEGNNTSPKLTLTENILEKECKTLLSDFFKKQRNNKK